MKMEYTLEDAFESLTDTQTELQQQIGNLADIISNSGSFVISETDEPEKIRQKQHKLCHSLLNHVLKEEPRDYPIPNTSDLHIDALMELEEEVRNVHKLHKEIEARLSDIKDDISYLENKKMGLEKMKEAYLNAAEMTANTDYSKEYIATKRMFQRVKKDLNNVVNILFPGNQEFQEFLGDLTYSYTRGGNEAYLDVTPEVLEFVNFLIEADIAVFHRNDRTKIKLIDML